MGVKSATEAVVYFQGPNGKTGQVNLHWEEENEDSVGRISDADVRQAFRLAIEGRSDLEGQAPVKVVLRERSVGQKGDVEKKLETKDPQFRRALDAYLMNDTLLGWMIGGAMETFGPAVSGALDVVSTLAGGASKVDQTKIELNSDQTRQLSELKRGLEFILADSDHLENPQFSESDLFHAHLVQKGKGTGFLFHTREFLPPPSISSKRNIVYWSGGSGYLTYSPKKGNTVYPFDLGAKEVGSFYFHPDKDKAMELARGNGTPVSMEVSDGQNNKITLWVVIPPQVI